MKPNEQRQAIAEHCGWKFQKGTEPQYGGTNIPRGWIPPGGGRAQINLPDYPNDLNAMHEAETTLVGGHSLWMKYNSELFKVVTDANLARAVQIPRYIFATITATAAQRAEAFLRTIEKWEDE